MGQGSDSDAVPSAPRVALFPPNVRWVGAGLGAQLTHPTGFCQVQSAQLGKISALLHRPKPANALWDGESENRAVQNPGSFATKNVFCVGLQNPNGGRTHKAEKIGEPRP